MYYVIPATFRLKSRKSFLNTSKVFGGKSDQGRVKRRRQKIVKSNENNSVAIKNQKKNYMKAKLSRETFGKQLTELSGMRSNKKKFNQMGIVKGL